MDDDDESKKSDEASPQNPNPVTPTNSNEPSPPQNPNNNFNFPSAASSSSSSSLSKEAVVTPTSNESSLDADLNNHSNNTPPPTPTSASINSDENNENIKQQPLELIWKSDYQSATLSKYIDFQDSFLQSVINDLNNVFIQLKNTNKQLILYKNKTVLSNFIKCTTYSSYVWYDYLMQLWNNADIVTSETNKSMWKKGDFLQYTACTIYKIFFTITNNDKISYPKDQTQFSLYQVLIEAKLLFINNNQQNVANCINVLSFICKKKLFLNDDKKIEPFENLYRRNHYNKQINDGKEKVLLMLNLNCEWTTQSLVIYFTNELQLEKDTRNFEREALQKKEDDFIVGKKKKNKKRK
jgi:hypothetical protein